MRVRSRELPDLAEMLVVELDGPNVAPENTDTIALLDLASAFFELVEVNANSQKWDLTLRDLHVVDKCVAVASRPSNKGVASVCVERAIAQVGGAKPPHGGVELVRRAQSTMRSFAGSIDVRLGFGDALTKIRLPESGGPLPIEEIIVVVATPLRIGGASVLARFRCEDEGEFTLMVTPDQARDLGPHLYLYVEIEAEVNRGTDGRITGGVLRHFEPFKREDPRPAWQRWFKSVGGDFWAGVEDVDKELGRGR